MRSRKLAIASGLLLVVATSVPALAQPASSNAPSAPYPAACTNVPPNVSDSAHSIYQGGKAYYDDANYDAAIQQFREAYKKDCSKHELLIIISRAYELKGDKAAAITALETYLERVPTSPDAPQHRTRIENMRKQIQAAAAASAASASAAPTTTAPTEMREHTVPPWIVVGLGGVAVVAGIVVIAISPSLPAGCSKDTETCLRLPNEKDSTFAGRQKEAGTSKSQPVYGAIVLGLGAVIVGGGLLWHFLEPTGPVEKTATVKKPKVTPEVAPGFAGLSLSGSF